MVAPATTLTATIEVMFANKTEIRGLICKPICNMN